MWKINKAEKNNEVLDLFDSKIMAPLRVALDETTLAAAEIHLPAFQLYQRKVKYDENKEETSISEELKKWYAKPYKKLSLQKKYQDACDALGNKTLPQTHKLPPEIKIIFSKLAYFFLFDKQALAEIGIINFSRTDYIENIINSSNIEVCPYCDATTILNSELVNIEHYLSRTSFPLLSTNNDNLLICCLPCNKRKSNRLPKNHHSPLITQHGDKITFELDGENIKIVSNVIETEEFISLVRLQELYGNSGGMLSLRICNEIAYLLQNPSVVAYMEKRRPYFFLKKHIVEKVESYPWLRPYCNIQYK